MHKSVTEAHKSEITDHAAALTTGRPAPTDKPQCNECTYRKKQGS